MFEVDDTVYVTHTEMKSHVHHESLNGCVGTVAAVYCPDLHIYPYEVEIDGVIYSFMAHEIDLLVNRAIASVCSPDLACYLTVAFGGDDDGVWLAGAPAEEA